MSREIKLTQGKATLVDDDDFEWLSQWKWYANKQGNKYYAMRNVSIGNGRHRVIRIHREIIQTPEGMYTDHIDGDGLNNQKSNLRICTNQQNQFNRGGSNGTSSKYKGVHWYKQTKRWHARIKINGGLNHIGYFNNEEEAAIAYNEAAVKYYGEFAKLNEV